MELRSDLPDDTMNSYHDTMDEIINGVLIDVMNVSMHKIENTSIIQDTLINIQIN